MDDVQQRGEVRIAVKDGAQGVCPECGQPAPGYDTRERKWRHLDNCQPRPLSERHTTPIYTHVILKSLFAFRTAIKV